MKKILTLTMNPAVDVATDVEHVQPTRKLRCGPARRDAGGGGINVARVLKRLGAPVTALFPAGGSIGALLEKLVEAEDVPCRAVPIDGETRENFTATEKSGDQFRFVLAGPALAAAEWHACLFATEDELAEGDILVASGSLPPGAPTDFYARAALVAHTAGARFILDTAGDALKAALGAGVSLVKPNLRELQDLTGETLVDEASQLAACRALVADGKTEAVALSLGADGALLVTADGAWRARGPDEKVASAVGAGDSFVAGLAWALADGKSMDEALRAGMAAGTAAVLTPGTELCHARDVDRLLAAIRIEAI
ncbi:MAG: 1-phosphofructokinase family hexose kinase [Alphaproteobacteria bacterium]|nr:MAG: 1-phosphofructokinase family hexose kinase [Alphaproteobacteria bacterium]